MTGPKSPLPSPEILLASLHGGVQTQLTPSSQRRDHFPSSSFKVCFQNPRFLLQGWPPSRRADCRSTPSFQGKCHSASPPPGLWPVPATHVGLSYIPSLGLFYIKQSWKWRMHIPVQVRLHLSQSISFSAFSYHRFKNLGAWFHLESPDMTHITGGTQYHHSLSSVMELEPLISHWVYPTWIKDYSFQPPLQLGVVID